MSNVQLDLLDEKCVKCGNRRDDGGECDACDERTVIGLRVKKALDDKISEVRVRPQAWSKRNEKSDGYVVGVHPGSRGSAVLVQHDSGNRLGWFFHELELIQ